MLSSLQNAGGVVHHHGGDRVFSDRALRPENDVPAQVAVDGDRRAASHDYPIFILSVDEVRRRALAEPRADGPAAAAAATLLRRHERPGRNASRSDRVPSTGVSAERAGRMLTFPEDVVLLLLDDEEGVFLSVGKGTLELALTGSVLMELGFANRIDTDLEHLTLVDPEPTGNPLLDDVLERIASRKEATGTREWIETLSVEETAAIQERVLASLVERGILKREQKRLLPETVQHLWVFRSPRYFVVDAKAKRAPEIRLVDALFSDEIPDVRDAALSCLVDACNVLPVLFGERVMERAAPRIELLRNMDLIGREISDAIAAIERSKVQSMAHPLA